MSGRRLQFGVAVLEDRLYVVGGRDGLKTLNTVECYDPKKKTWTLMPPMSTHRHGLGTTRVCNMCKLCCVVLCHISCMWAK
jgi:kelch-like protein 1/4/5